ncbi:MULTISPECIES: SRPBCC family protein [unclassified Streptomyces]|uniref:SRPBCC family protein n=1 Tax=unclassified Streptomyces TaxID=2593676 RepID=UPI00037A892F|nr:MULTISPECIES: SRPBCC family protein [unclassified Streptomyces]MYY00750.1 SRPBCC family protein [Streptomyces sp. SID4913]
MAVRHRLIERPVKDVWKVLADGTLYSDWVVGTSDSRPRRGAWPEVGSSITYTLGLGPWSMQGTTYVRRCEAPHVLELEADSGRIGTARIALEVRQWGENALVTLDEHPLRGPAGKLHNTAADALIQLRHRSVLARLATTVETSPKGTREAV